LELLISCLVVTVYDTIGQDTASLYALHTYIKVELFLNEIGGYLTMRNQIKLYPIIHSVEVLT